MFDFNGVSIKGSDDLQKALLIKMEKKSFVDQFQWMVNRWGLESCLGMLFSAIYGAGTPGEYDHIEPLVKFKFKIEFDNYEDPGDDGHLVPIKDEG